MDKLAQQLTEGSARPVPQFIPTPDEALNILVALLLAAILGFVLAMIYHWTYTGKKERRGQMVYTIVLLCLGGSLVWLIVADNLVRAFGLAGALAMIRYRTRMQDPKDTTMVFFAIIIGMACGLHAYFIAFLGTFFIGLVLWIILLVDNNTSVGRRIINPKNGGQDNGPPNELVSMGAIPDKNEDDNDESWSE